jgi:hypothetical protein
MRTTIMGDMFSYVRIACLHNYIDNHHKLDIDSNIFILRDDEKDVSSLLNIVSKTKVR